MIHKINWFIIDMRRHLRERNQFSRIENEVRRETWNFHFIDVWYSTATKEKHLTDGLRALTYT